MYAYYETQYLGAAHRLTGILQLLMSVPNYFQHNPEAEKDVKASVAFLLSIQFFEGNFPCSMGELKDPRHHNEELVHWCHGAPGTVYLLARAHLLWGDEVYMVALVKASSLIWKKGLLKKGPGLCHGISGTGYVFPHDVPPHRGHHVFQPSPEVFRVHVQRSVQKCENTRLSVQSV